MDSSLLHPANAIHPISVEPISAQRPIFRWFMGVLPGALPAVGQPDSRRVDEGLVLAVEPVAVHVLGAALLDEDRELVDVHPPALVRPEPVAEAEGRAGAVAVG